MLVVGDEGKGSAAHAQPKVRVTSEKLKAFPHILFLVGQPKGKAVRRLLALGPPLVGLPLDGGPSATSTGALSPLWATFAGRLAQLPCLKADITLAGRLHCPRRPQNCAPVGLDPGGRVCPNWPEVRNWGARVCGPVGEDAGRPKGRLALKQCHQKGDREATCARRKSMGCGRT